MKPSDFIDPNFEDMPGEMERYLLDIQLTGIVNKEIQERSKPATSTKERLRREREGWN